jgi:hypothetical protein
LELSSTQRFPEGTGQSVCAANVTDPLTLRRYSTRAHITSTSFVNEYNWGDLT